MKLLIALAAAALTTAVHADEDYPDDISENAGNSFTQRWRQTDASDIDMVVFEFVGNGDGDIDIVDLSFRGDGWAASESNGMFIGVRDSDRGNQNRIKFNLKFDGYNRWGGDSHHSWEQTFTWRVTYFHEGEALYGWEWSNSGDSMYNIGHGFGGRFDYLDTNDNRLANLVPLPHPAVMAGLGLSGIAATRRRRSV